MTNLKITVESKDDVIAFEKRCETVDDFLHIFRTILFNYHFDQALIDQVMDSEFEERPQELLKAIGLFEDVKDSLDYHDKTGLSAQFTNWLERIKELNLNNR